VNGKAVYFGWGDGFTDRNGYEAAVNGYLPGVLCVSAVHSPWVK
jgi:hypothetical protein